jgi:hypothetical protein
MSIVFFWDKCLKLTLFDICAILSRERLFKSKREKKHFHLTRRTIRHFLLKSSCRSPRVTHQHRRKAWRQKATIQPLEALFRQFPNAFAEYLGGAVLFENQMLSVSLGK